MTNEKFFDKLTELLMFHVKQDIDDDEKKYWINKALKNAYSEGRNKEIILRVLENNK